MLLNIFLFVGVIWLAIQCYRDLLAIQCYRDLEEILKDDKEDDKETFKD